MDSGSWNTYCKDWTLGLLLIKMLQIKINWMLTLLNDKNNVTILHIHDWYVN
jgi:hypothetical protein